MTVEVILEHSDGDIWGRVEGKGHYLPVTVGQTIEEVTNNIRELIRDYLEHEGKDDPYWQRAIGKEIKFVTVLQDQLP